MPQSAMADASQAAPGSALMVRAYALTAFMYHASGDIAAAASLCGQAMQEWDRDAAGVDADRDARVASSLKYASAGLHATLSMADDDVLKVGFCQRGLARCTGTCTRTLGEGCAPFACFYSDKSVS